MSRRWVGQIPNALSISRIFMAFAFPFIAPSLRIPMIALSLLSEFLDGFLARKLNAVTPLGTLLDPIADKLFILSTVGVLLFERELTYLQFLLIAARDITVAIGTLSVVNERRKLSIAWLQPRWSGKIATTFQFALLISLFAHFPYSGFLIQATIVASCVSAIDYLYQVLHARFDLTSAR